MEPNSTGTADSASYPAGKRARQQELLVVALLTHSSVEKAGRSIGISKSTALRWLADAAFKAALRSARQEVLDAAVGRLHQVATEAVETLRASLHAKTPTVRVSAARTVLEFAFRARVEFDWEARLAALEQRLGEDGGAS